MKIYISKYQIHFTKKLNSQIGAGSREGALLKLQLSPFISGYADLFPFPEFGEADLDSQIADFQAGKPSVLVRRALALADVDARARARQRSLFAGLVLPASHKRVRNVAEAQEAFEDGFTRLKVKMGADLERETEWLEEWAAALDPKARSDRGSVLLRLDFNGALSEPQFATWWNSLTPLTRSFIDFIEDAFDPRSVSYAELLRWERSAPLAWDWYKPDFPVKCVIVKPLREAFENVSQHQRVIFTHSMGHRVGQAASLWSAARFYRKYPQLTEIGGLRPTERTPEWLTRGERILPPEGTGFGFDKELADRRWELLS